MPGNSTRAGLREASGRLRSVVAADWFPAVSGDLDLGVSLPGKAGAARVRSVRRAASAFGRAYGVRVTMMVPVMPLRAWPGTGHRYR